MLTFRMPSGRRVEMTSLHVLGVMDYLWQDGKPLDSRQQVGERIAGHVRRFYPEEDAPFTILWSSHGSALCVASFTSQPLVGHEFEAYSYLILCWFVWHTDRHL